MCNIFIVKKIQFDLLINCLIKWWRIIFYRQNIYGKNRINFMFILHSVYKMKINVKLCKIHLLKHETFRTLVLVILIGADLTQSHSFFIATSSKLNFNSEDISWDDNFLFLSFHEKKINCNLWFFFACNFCLFIILAHLLFCYDSIQFY